MARYNKARARRKAGEGVDICDDCASAQWDMKFHNLDVHGKPILLRCPLEDFAIIRGTRACEHFRPKNIKQ